MGCKPSKDAIRASATAQDDHGHNNHHIKQVDKNVIEDVVTEQKIISLKENEGENETAQEKLTSMYN
ncbi:hypothetical protein O3M35_005593 [Rhynocoris fuscipes]|uniref:Uncharacterized protein n=1 Tax=Rhynocoris fuscipes TaxID=488301 RepID=A0AAW1DKQ5_9HEMI